MLLKYPSGLRGKNISGSILGSIKSCQLSWQDIKYLLLLENKNIVLSIMTNRLVPDKYKYRIILLNAASYGYQVFNDSGKLYKHLLKRIKYLDKYYDKKYENTITWIIQACKTTNNLHLLPGWAIVYGYKLYIIKDTDIRSDSISINDVIKAGRLHKLGTYEVRPFLKHEISDGNTIKELLLEAVKPDYVLSIAAEILQKNLLNIDFDSFVNVVIKQIVLNKPKYGYRDYYAIFEGVLKLYNKEKGGVK